MRSWLDSWSHMRLVEQKMMILDPGGLLRRICCSLGILSYGWAPHSASAWAAGARWHAQQALLQLHAASSKQQIVQTGSRV